MVDGSVLDALSAVAHVATAAAVIVAAWQLVLSKRQAVTTFEDSLVKEYRDIAATLPTKALLGERLGENEHFQNFDAFYRYFDLCNQQVFLFQAGRVSRTTWRFWKDGMASNIRRPAFARAWSEIAARSNGDFSELRSVFPPDPPLEEETSTTP